MQAEMVEIGKTHPEWAQNYQTIAESMEQQAQELKGLYHKILMMRYETALVGLKYFKAIKQLHLVRELIDAADP